MLGVMEVFTLYEQLSKLSAFLSSSHTVSKEWQVSIKSLCEGQKILGPLKLIPPLRGVLLPVILKIESRQ